jgi:hypothetical protein
MAHYADGSNITNISGCTPNATKNPRFGFTSLLAGKQASSLRQSCCAGFLPYAWGQIATDAERGGKHAH